MPSKAKTGKKLVIVESPAKSKTIAKYLGEGFIVEASIGHIRDLPQPSELPAELKKTSVGKFAVDIENDFKPYYVVSPDKKKKVAELKAQLKDADALYLATDGDREGEAIAWHLLEVLKPKVPVYRMTFGEITKEAIHRAMDNLRDVDQDLVDAQETRRVLDRLYGYEISPVLWRKVARGLSAGRVQSVVTRMVVDRERERMAFKAASYWDLTGQFGAGSGSFKAKLATVDGAKVASGRDFNDNGELTSRNAVHLNEELATSLAAGLQDADFRVRSVDTKPYTRRPAAPFTTSTLQQEAGRKLRFSSKSTMQVAQRLYENGYITYMRTDSSALSNEAVTAARRQASELYGPEYVPASPRVYSGKAANAQEAHEAIRPAGDSFRTPAQVAKQLSGDEFRLYELIWKRTVASQMADAKGSTATIRLGAVAARRPRRRILGLRHRHHLPRLPRRLRRGQGRKPRRRRLRGSPPPAERGQGRRADRLGDCRRRPRDVPAAALHRSVADRRAGKEGHRPPVHLRLHHLHHPGPRLRPEAGLRAGPELDRVLRDPAARTALPRLRGLRVHGRHGSGPGQDRQRPGRGARLAQALLLRRGLRPRPAEHRQQPRRDRRPRNQLHSHHRRASRCGSASSARTWKAPSRPSIAKTGEVVEAARANVPEDLAPDELTAAKAVELMETAAPEERVLGADPHTGHTVVAKNGRYGAYVTEIIPEMTEEQLANQPVEYYKNGKPKPPKKPVKAKPRTGSLFASMSVDTITLDEALQLMSLPRVLGQDAEGNPITVQNGRFGPYLKKGTDSRSIGSEEEIFTITLEQALEIYSQPKQRGARAAVPPLAEFGPDPVSEKNIVVKEGRFGPYITDGVTNITVPRSTSLEELTREQAVELLAEKRAKGPVKRTTTARKAPARKAAAKK